jgi:hypothetical protein
VASEKQILANRANAQKSTGPGTSFGRSRSRRNALKHGLTARAVHTLEDDREFNQFAKSIADQYQPSTALQTELVNRLVSVLWRLRRAHAIETGLLSIQIKLQRDIHLPEHQIDILQMFGLASPMPKTNSKLDEQRQCLESNARAFLRLVNFNGQALDHLSRYEVSLWRQAAQLILMLEGAAHRSLP